MLAGETWRAQTLGLGHLVVYNINACAAIGASVVAALVLKNTARASRIAFAHSIDAASFKTNTKLRNCN